MTEAEQVQQEPTNENGDKLSREVGGVKVWKTKKSGKEYVMSPKLDDMVKLHWLQGHSAAPIAFNLGHPQDHVEAVIKVAAEERLRQGMPLPQRLGAKGANNTPPSEVA